MSDTEKASFDATATIEHLMACGELLANQLPQPSAWTPELRLAAAVLAATIVEVRDHAHDPHYQRRIEEDLLWINGDDDTWPFSFVRLCHLFALEPAWVRSMVRDWMQRSTRRPSENQRYRHAA